MATKIISNAFRSAFESIVASFPPEASRGWIHRTAAFTRNMFHKLAGLTAFQEGPLCQFTVKSGPKEAIGQEALDQGFSNVPVLPPNLLAKTVLT